LRYQGSQIYIRGPCTPWRKMFCTQSEYFITFITSISVFNFNFLALVVSFLDNRGVPNLHYGALCPTDVPWRKRFCTQSEYFTRCSVFNCNFLAVVVYGILGGSQIYIRGPCTHRMPPCRKILTHPSTCLYHYNCKVSAL